MNIQDKHFSNQLNAYLDSQIVSLEEQERQEKARQLEIEIEVANQIAEFGEEVENLMTEENMQCLFNDLMSIELKHTDPHKTTISEAYNVIRAFIAFKVELENRLTERAGEYI